MDDVGVVQPGEGELIVVATPLGNLGDITSRALAVLERADVVYCEDTRHSRTIFSAFDIATRGRLRALHEHNEASLCEEIIAQVARGWVVAVVSDAGTPGISDPGARVVAAVANAGLRVTTAPGPSAVVAALSVSGLATDRFVMEGFVSRRASERAEAFGSWAEEPRTVVFYESPQRLARTLHELALLYPERRAVVARELTKMHEEVARATLEELAARFATRAVRGEVVVLIEGASPVDVDDEAVRAGLVGQLASGASLRDAASNVAEGLGVSRRRAYQMALSMRNEPGV